jgi:hypothetical protein
MIEPVTLILPNLVHKFDTLSCRAWMRIAYVYQAREESDGETPMYPESVDIESVECVAVHLLDEAGDAWTGFPGSRLRPPLADAVAARFRVEVPDDRLEALCLEDARSRQEE